MHLDTAIELATLRHDELRGAATHTRHAHRRAPRRRLGRHVRRPASRGGA